MYIVTSHQLDALEQDDHSPSLTICGSCIGVLMTAIATLTTGSVADSFWQGAFAVILLVSFLLSCFYGFQAFRSRRATQRRIREIKSHPVR